MAIMEKCDHIYQYTKEAVCPSCGEYTHTPDWKLQANMHKEWIISGKATYNGWWSI